MPLLLLLLLPIAFAVELIDHCEIEHQHIHLHYTPHFLPYHGAVRTNHDIGYIDGIKCCDIHPDMTSNPPLGLCDLYDSCIRKHYNTKLKNLTVVTTSVPSSSHHYVCRDLLVDEAPVYPIFGHPDKIDEEAKEWLDTLQDTCDCSMYTGEYTDLIIVMPVSIAVFILIYCILYFWFTLFISSK